jgi:hypothetical protein
MTATSHAIVGTVIAAKVGNPALAIPIALASHVILDAIPHWDTITNGNAKNAQKLINTIIDFAVSLILSWVILVLLFPQTSIYYAFFIIIVAQLFDWLTMPYKFFGIKPFFIWIYKFQKLFDRKLDKPWGIITQVATIIAILIIAKLV